MKTEKFHERLARLRKDRKLTVAQLTTELRVPASTYRAWEYGRAIQGPEAFVGLAHVLGVSLDELLVGTQPQLSALIDKLEQAERLSHEVRTALLSLG